MATDIHPPRVYICPKCNHEHRADLSAMEGHPEIHGKVHCMGCHVLLWLSLGEDGQAKTEVYEEHLHDTADAGASAEPAGDSSAVADERAKHAEMVRETERSIASAAAASAESKEASGPSAQETESTPTAAPAGGGAILRLVTTAIVAAVVSYLVVMANRSEPKEVKDDTALDAVKLQIDALDTDLAAARADAKVNYDALTRIDGELQTLASTSGDVRAHGEALEATEKWKTSMTEALQGLQDAFKSLNGRIEGNYTELRAAQKRLKALEGGK